VATRKKNKERPVIVVTMGDAAGVGPEIVVKTLVLPGIRAICRPVVVGDLRIIQKAANLLGQEIRIQCINSVHEISDDDCINLMDMDNVDISGFMPGKVASVCGKASMEFIDKAVKLVLSGKGQAIVTTPINKEAAILAGYTDMGHLEYMAHLTGAKEYATMLISGKLRTVHLTTHYSLLQACMMVKKETILSKLILTNDSFIKWGFKKPKIGVAALNPHSGEGGLLGKEEIIEIIPAINKAREKGIDARGPFPADSIFVRAINGEFDVVLAMYHDQGHIPVKVYGFEKSISVALGLPFIRTSVDHGTAFDIAWQGKANPDSLVEAIKVAVSICNKNMLSM